MYTGAHKNGTHLQRVSPSTMCVIFADTAVLDFEQIGFEVVKNTNFSVQIFSEKVPSHSLQIFSQEFNLKNGTYIKNNTLWHRFPTIEFSQT